MGVYVSLSKGVFECACVCVCVCMHSFFSLTRSAVIYSCMFARALMANVIVSPFFLL